MILGLFTAIIVTGGPTPDVSFVPQEFSELSKCWEQVEAMKDVPPAEAFDKEGRPILYTFYKCVPFEQGQLEQALAQVKAGS